MKAYLVDKNAQECSEKYVKKKKMQYRAAFVSIFGGNETESPTSSANYDTFEDEVVFPLISWNEIFAAVESRGRFDNDSDKSFIFSALSEQSFIEMVEKL